MATDYMAVSLAVSTQYTNVMDRHRSTALAGSCLCRQKLHVVEHVVTAGLNKLRPEPHCMVLPLAKLDGMIIDCPSILKVDSILCRDVALSL